MTTKTYYLGRTTAGAVVARASGSDYGYTHATVRVPARKALDNHNAHALSDMAFSRSAAGAISGASRNRWPDHELVSLEVVDRATYKAATGKA